MYCTVCCLVQNCSLRDGILVRKYWYLIVAAVVGLVLLFTGLPQHSSLPGIPVCKPGEVMIELDTNDDGNTDFRAFLDQDSVPVGTVGDTNFDGNPDNCDNFKNGRVFHAQQDTDNNGIIDYILFYIYDEEERNMREVLFLLEEENLFTITADTGWLECSTTSSTNPYFHTYRDGYPPAAIDNH